ncbi:MAG TPA: MlaD family protein [Gemmatimonadaceae bacterium]|nr:MlaD family protein [Gemmatimonadaceae bacterium]
MGRADSRIGILAFLATTGLVLVSLLVFARYPGVVIRGREFRAEFTSVAGLNVGDDVRYGGLPVGTITAMELAPEDPTKIVVEFRVRRRTPIRVDTRATISQVGLLGEPYLNLQPGSPEAATLPAGSVVPSANTINVQEALTRLAAFFDRADTLLGVVERASRSGTLDRVDRTLARVEGLVASADAGSNRVFDRLETAGGRLDDVLTRTDRLVAALDTSLRATTPGLAETQREALAALRELHVLLADTRDALQSGGGLDALVRNLAVTSDNMARLSTRLERDPTSVLLRRDNPRKPAGPPARD